MFLRTPIKYTSNKRKRLCYGGHNTQHFNKQHFNKQYVNEQFDDTDSQRNSDDCEYIAIPRKKDDKKVYRLNNHIYFRTEVTTETVATLCELIDEMNREFESFQSGLTTVMIVPKPIYLHITSLGGDLMVGFTAYDYIEKSKIPIYTVAEGYAISSGANMFMAGKKRFMLKNSYLLIHQLSAPKYGEETYHVMMDNAANVIESMSRTYATFLNNIRHSRQNVPESDILTKERLENHMMHDIYWNADTCMRYGLVDAIYTNYQDHDEHDILTYLTCRLSASAKTTKTYSLDELRPSEFVINRIKGIRESEEEKERSRLSKIIENYLDYKSSTSPQTAIVNVDNVDNVDNIDNTKNLETYDVTDTIVHPKRQKIVTRSKTKKGQK